MDLQFSFPYKKTNSAYFESLLEDFEVFWPFSEQSSPESANTDIHKEESEMEFIAYNKC